MNGIAFTGSEFVDIARESIDLQRSFALKNPEASSDDKLRKATKEFEGFMMGQMFKSMYSSIPKSELSGDSSNTRDVFMSLYIDEIAKLGSLGKNGIAETLYQQISHKTDLSQEAKKELDVIAATGQTPHENLAKQVEALATDKSGQTLKAEEVLDELRSLMGNLKHKVSSGYGMREHPIFKAQHFHHGIDYALPEGHELSAPTQAKVAFAGRKGGYGNTVILDHGHGISSMYAHLAEISVKEGDALDKGFLIGKVGSTGLSTGPHLHFEVRKEDKSIDPNSLASLEKTSKGL